MIVIDSLSKAYDSTGTLTYVLQNVNMTINRGDIFGLIGQSGAGKSSLMKCLSLQIPPTSGTIFFHGRNTAFNHGHELREFRKKIGMIFQGFNLFSSRTVSGNIAFPLEIAGITQEEQKMRIDELLELVGLTAKKNVYPSKLSGGEKQRVGIARALAGKPELLLCDEATSALDPKTTKEILDLLRHVNQKLGVTIFLITHEMEVIRRICNKVAVIDQGCIIEQGLVSDVFFNPQETLTKAFLQNATHEIPPNYFNEVSANHKLLRLTFKGQTAGEPIISRLSQMYHIEANILLGFIDNLQASTIGNLVIELKGSEDSLKKAFSYLEEQSILYEVLEK